MVRDFRYFTLSPLIDRSSQQYIFEGGIEAVGDASSLPALNLEYRFVYDSENEENGASVWQPYSVGVDNISTTSGGWFAVQFRNTSGMFSNNPNNYYHVKSTYDFDAGGKIMSLIDYMNDSAGLSNNEFNSLFRETKIHDAHEIILPDRVSNGCYQDTFNGCTSLTTAPELPATTLADFCYSYMFKGCTSLTTAPALPATTLNSNCYSYMFNGCKSLTTAPASLPATTLADYCYEKMFEGCQSLTTAPALPATSLAKYCYRGMFQNCTSLTTAPALPATTLNSGCYQGMLSGCTSLTTAPELPATTLAILCYNGTFSGCTSLTTAPELPATTLADSCYFYMFNGCTSLTAAPALPAMTLARNCYAKMFMNCQKIDRIVWKSTTIPSSTYCSDWLNGASASGKFEYTDPTLDVASITRDSSGVPAGWSISLLSQKTKLLLKINNASVDNISLFGKKIASLSINDKKVKSSSAA